MNSILNDMIARGLASTLPRWQEQMIKQHKGSVALAMSVPLHYVQNDLPYVLSMN